MKNKVKKEKGARLERYLVEVLRETIDKDTHRTTGSGSGLDKNDVRISSLDIEIEAKNAEKVNLIKDWEQTKKQETTGNVSVLAIRNPKKPEFKEVLVVMGLNDWIDLLRGATGEAEIISNKDNDLKFKLRRLKDLIGQIDKKLEYE